MSESDLERAYTPQRLRGLTLRNRFVKSATYEGACPGGVPSEEVLAHHERLARGGVALTTLAYCAVDSDARTFEDQLWLREEVRPRLTELTRRVHAAGGAISAQLSHAGYFTRNRGLGTTLPRGPSLCLNEYGLASGKPVALALTRGEIARRVAAFGAGAAFAREVGFDAVEIHMGHGYLLSQFISPLTNRRHDDYGGSVAGRMRLPLEVVARVRAAVGEDFPVLCKINLSDGVRGGLEIEDAARGAALLEAAGVDALVLSGGFTSKSPFFLLRGEVPLPQMIRAEPSPLQRLALKVFAGRLIRPFPFEPLFFLALARQIRRAVKLPLAYLGGVTGPRDVATVMAEGFELCAMARTLIADPHMVARMREMRDAYATPCDRCNQCVAAMSEAGGVRCVKVPAPAERRAT